MSLKSIGLSSHPIFAKNPFGTRPGLAIVLATTLVLAFPNHAQDEDATSADEDIEEVVVTGTRSTIQNSIEVKRNSDQIVDALSADDIGDIPALSIGEALETLTSAASHREQGGATEISIRGMGPFLGATTINGREATNGSGDRSVNFSQFPSELFNKLQIYKTQSASLIEGGVSGQIALSTLKPLEYGKQRFQSDFKLNHNPDNADIENQDADMSRRVTLSFVDQYELDNGSAWGFSIGAQSNITTNPEQEYRSSSGYRDCRNDPNVPGGVYRTSSGNCDSGSGNLNLVVDPSTGAAPDGDAPFIFVPSSRSFRQNITGDERESVFAALQIQPRPGTDINFDLQWAERDFTEVRNDLVFAEHRRMTSGLTADSLRSSPDGSIAGFVNEGRVETHSYYQERLEDYIGGGFSVYQQINDRLSLAFDWSYSDTSRREHILNTRLQSEDNDIYGNDVPADTDRPRAAYVLRGTPSEVMLVTIRNFDVTNHDLFADSARTRIDLNQARDNSIRAIRADFTYDMASSGITEILGGVRQSSLFYDSVPRNRDQRTFSDDAIAGASEACRNDVFPEEGFLSTPANGQTLITNIDDNGNVIASGTGDTWATFDPLCLVREFVGTVPPWPKPQLTISNVNVRENTTSSYLQANYVSEFMDRAVRGNFGVRVVSTEVESTGLRTILTTTRNDDDTITVNEDSSAFEVVVGGSRYTEMLPSFSAVMDWSDDVLVRAGVFRGLSRPDPADLGFGRRLSVDDDDATSIADLVGSASASGNPDLLPLTSWNFDLAVEWYPNEDSIFAAGFYYKRFLGGFENTQRVETFTIDGADFNADVTTTRTDENESTLTGVELTVAHSFNYLPGLWSGFGAKLSMNFANSDFEFEDQNFGASQVLNEAGQVVSERVGIVEPANLFGFSDSVISSQVYYDAGKLDLQLIHKSRSEYFQQFISSPGLIRYVGDNQVLEARATYKVTDSVSVRFEAINLLDEPKRQYIPVRGYLTELNSYGPRMFFGMKIKI